MLTRFLAKLCLNMCHECAMNVLYWMSQLFFHDQIKFANLFVQIKKSTIIFFVTLLSFIFVVPSSP